MTKKLLKLSDEELMNLYREGNFDSFAVLYERHSGKVLGYLNSKVNLESSKDLLQETFIKLHEAKEKYNSLYPFLPWLFTIARNTLFDFFKNKETKIEQQSDSTSLANLIDNTEEVFYPSENLSHGLQNLPDLQRRAIELRYMNDWSFEKIALDIKTSPENVRQLISRGIKKIKNSIKRNGDL